MGGLKKNQPSNRLFHKFWASKSVSWPSRTPYNYLISWSWGFEILKGPVGRGLHFSRTKLKAFPGIVHSVNNFDDSLAQDLDEAGRAEGLEPGRGAVVVVIAAAVRERAWEVAAENHSAQDSISSGKDGV